MRVVMISKALLVGAYQRKAELLAAAPGVALTVVVPREWRGGGMRQTLERAHADGYELIQLPLRFPGSFHLHHYLGLERVLADRRPDLAHVDEEPYNLATHRAVRSARDVGAKTLFFTWQNLDRRYPPPFAGWERAVYRAVDGAIAGSRDAEAVLRAKGFRGPTWVIPQVGVDPDAYRPLEPPRPRDAGRLHVGFAGRLVPEKGVDLLIDAIAGLPGVTLTVLGDGPERGRLRARAVDRGVLERVAFAPARPSTAMPAFYRALDALVLPSRTTRRWVEQFGRVLVEAMACGVPCIGAASGEIPNVLGDAGLTFPEGDANALRQRLAELSGQPERRAALATAGRARVLERFAMARVAEETLAAWRAIVGS